MTDCELLAGCIFFNNKMANMPATAEMLKARYCRSDNDQCARYIIYKQFGRPLVPPDLFPNDHERAKKILEMK